MDLSASTPPWSFQMHHSASQRQQGPEQGEMDHLSREAREGLESQSRDFLPPAFLQPSSAPSLTSEVMMLQSKKVLLPPRPGTHRWTLLEPQVEHIGCQQRPPAGTMWAAPLVDRCHPVWGAVAPGRWLRGKLPDFWAASPKCQLKMKNRYAKLHQHL